MLVLVSHIDFHALQRTTTLDKFHCAFKINIHVVVITSSCCSRLLLVHKCCAHIRLVEQRQPVTLLCQGFRQRTHTTITQFTEIAISHEWENHFAKEQCWVGIVFLRCHSVIKFRIGFYVTFVGLVRCPLRCTFSISINTFMQEKVQWCIIKGLFVVNCFQKGIRYLVRVLVNKRRVDHRVHVRKARARTSAETKANLKKSSCRKNPS
mmetsp:Transcript_14574/g.21599  ORF Transcript_14574/g.21599 Transcript_14574/m.21599 type:complete len:208 (+) Transcript_14574:103-726(+)